MCEMNELKKVLSIKNRNSLLKYKNDE